MPWMEAVGLGKLRWAGWKWSSLCDWFRVHTWLFLVGPELEGGQRWRNPSIINQVLAVWANCYRGLVWLPGLVAGDSGLASCKPDAAGCLPGLFTVDHGLVVVAEGGPECCCLAWPQSVCIFSLSFHLWRVNQNQAPYCFLSHSYGTRAHPSFWSRIKPPWTSSWNRSHKNFQKPIRNRKLVVLKQWRVGFFGGGRWNAGQEIVAYR